LCERPPIVGLPRAPQQSSCSGTPAKTYPNLMKIGFLWHCVYPWDIRLEKMIGAVIGEGNTACVICKSRPDLPRREQHGALTIRRVVAPPRLRWINRLATFPLFFNPLWIQETRQAMREEGLDILIVRDVP